MITDLLTTAVYNFIKTRITTLNIQSDLRNRSYRTAGKITNKSENPAIPNKASQTSFFTLSTSNTIRSSVSSSIFGSTIFNHLIEITCTGFVLGVIRLSHPANTGDIVFPILVARGDFRRTPVLLISPSPLRFTSPPPDPSPAHTPTNHPPPPHPNPQEAPHKTRVTQAPAGAINHEQIRAAVAGQDCGWRIVVLKSVRVSASN